jgi:hypothetical protein
MGFLEKLKSFKPKESPELQELRKVHPNFRFADSSWLFNESDPRGEWPAGKVRFAFDDAHLLDDCPFYAKIGFNSDSNVQGKYIGFAYTNENDLQKLTAWASKFPFAELYDNLSPTGIRTPDSSVRNLKQ